MNLFLNLRRGIRSYVAAVFRRLPQPLRYHLRGRWRLPPTDEYLSPKYRRRIREDLNERIKAGPGPSIWFLPTHTWFSSAFQRPQHMAHALADVGCPVVYYEPWSHGQLIITKDGLRERRFFGVRDLAPRLHLLRCPEDLLQEYMSECTPDALIMMWPEQARYIPAEISSFIVYEMIDDHTLATYADTTWHRTHHEWVRKADLVVATADDLLHQLFSERPDTLLLPNGVRLEDWGSTTPCSVPQDMATARHATVVVGYYGSIAEWFDWRMWELAARAKTDWAFVLIGLPYDGNYKKIIERMKCTANMYYLGAKPYSSLPGYLAHFDVATIPFILNRITHACSPLKLFEYMAAGKPIVASPMREILKYKSVFFADTPEKYVSQLEEALGKKNNPEYRRVLKQEAEANTWRSRGETLRQAIEFVRRRQNNIPRRHTG